MAKDASLGKSTLKPIGNIKLGDRVLAFAEWKGKGTDAKADARLSYERVEHVIASEHQQRLVHITLASGETLTATDGHPFIAPDGWRDAIMLKKGGQLLLKGDSEPPKIGVAQAGNTATIADVSTETRIVKVFNLEVANAHTYFVGKDGVGVHNDVIENKRNGDSYRDEVARQMREEGRRVRTEREVRRGIRVPGLGMRFPDIYEYDDVGKLINLVECKKGKSRYTKKQREKDQWIRENLGIPTEVKRG